MMYIFYVCIIMYIFIYIHSIHDFPTMGSWGHAPLTTNLIDQNLVEGFDLLKDGPPQEIHSRNGESYCSKKTVAVDFRFDMIG